jgi:hypothetical protein
LLCPGVIDPPDFFEEFIFRDDLFVVHCEELEELIFSLREIDLFSFPGDFMMFLIDDEFSEFDFFCSFVILISPRKCSYPSDELSIVTGLREVVISPIVESRYDIILCPSGSEHDDGGRFSLAPEPPTDLDTVHPRELDIEDDDIIVAIHGFHISLLSIGSESTGDIMCCEVSYDCLCERDVIFYEESIHMMSLVYRFSDTFVTKSIGKFQKSIL